MELRHLRYFRVVAEQLNFSRAAEQLRIAQPPLSLQIRQLEEELGVSLLDRRTRPLRLTDAGRFFLDQTLQVLARVDEMTAGARRIGSGRGGCLGVGFVGSAMYGPFPAIVRVFRARFPDIELRLHEMTTVEQIDALKHRQIHIGFGRLALADPEISQEVLFEEPLVVALSTSHALARKRRPLAMTELAEEAFVLYPSMPRPSYADNVIALCRTKGFIPRVVQMVVQLETALGLVAAGLGVTIVPASVRSQMREGVHYLQLCAPVPTSPLVLNSRLNDASATTEMFRTITHSAARSRLSNAT